MLTLLLASQALAGAPLADGPRLRLTLFDETTALPFTRLVEPPLHPGAMVGVTAWQHQGELLDHRLYLSLSGYHHARIENTLVLGPEWQTTFWPRPWLGLSGAVGLGYKQAFYPGPAYGQSEDGTWERQVDLGQAQVCGTLGLGLEVPVAQSWSLISQYRATIDAPTSLYGASPFLTHVMLHVGVEHRL